MTSADTIASILAILIAITVHEFSHAWMANYLGDPTAKLEGRLSLNPLVHLDPLGAIMLFLVHFGWAKPVPYNPYNLKNPRLGSLLIALAGPVSNFITALLFSIPLKYIAPDNPLANLFFFIVLINLGLMVFNFIPLPPLDGSNILAYFIPAKYYRQYAIYMQNGPLILFGIIMLEVVTGIRIISPIIFFFIQRLALFMGIAS